MKPKIQKKLKKLIKKKNKRKTKETKILKNKPWLKFLKKNKNTGIKKGKR